jgi:hypothetical protein
MSTVLPIDADCESTWPKALLRGLDAHRQGLADFQIERARIDRAELDDVALRIDRPSNPHQAAWDAALVLAERTIASGHLLGFHATRLMDHEVEDIRRRGLEPLSVELLERRLLAAESVGALTPEQAAPLLARHQAADDNRSRRTAFFFTRAQLKNAGLDRLCRFWGGEALYRCHKDDEETGPLLRSLGTPCIVVAAVSVADIEQRLDIHCRLVDVWCARRDIRTEHGPEFGGVVRAPTPSILRIVKLGDPEFVVLTGHDKWRRPLS